MLVLFLLFLELSSLVEGRLGPAVCVSQDPRSAVFWLRVDKERHWPEIE